MATERSDPEYGEGSRLEKLARRNAWALRNTASWLHRRVDRLTWTDRRTLRWQFSIDFTIPPRLEPFDTQDDGQAVFFVPIALLRKWPPLSAFDLRDENDRPIPLLTSRKNRAVDAATLLGLAPPGHLRNQLEGDLTAISLEPAKSAEKALDRVSEVLEDELPNMAPRTRQQWSEVGKVGASVSQSSILWVRVVGRKEERRIVKGCFEHVAETEPKLRRRIVAAFSWGPVRHRYELGNLGERGSYHLEITPPPGLHIRGARLELADDPPRRERVPVHEHGFLKRLRSDWRYLRIALAAGVRMKVKRTFRSLGPGDVPPLPPGSDEPEAGEAYQLFHPERAHLYVRATSDEYGTAQIEHAADRGLIGASFVAGLAISLLLTVGTVAFPEVTTHFGATITTLLLIPGLLGYLVVRPGEHPETRRHLVGVRTLILSAGALPVLAAVTLLVTTEACVDNARPWWTAYAIMAWLITALLFASWVLPPEEEPT